MALPEFLRFLGQSGWSSYLSCPLCSHMRNAPDETPATLGFSMPAEWEKHEATWLGWPHNATDWPDKLDTIRWVYGEMVRKISAGETVRILVRNRAEERVARWHLSRAGADVRKVQFVIHATNRG